MPGVKVSLKSKRAPDSSRTRFGRRTPLELQVRLAANGNALGRGIIRNASISGAYIACAVDLPLHTNLVVMLSIPGESAPAVRRLDACIVRSDADGFGIEWRGTASMEITDLLATIA